MRAYQVLWTVKGSPRHSAVAHTMTVADNHRAAAAQVQAIYPKALIFAVDAIDDIAE